MSKSQFKSATAEAVKKKKTRVLANRYEIVKRLGKGNYGTAYLCKDLRSKTSDSSYELKVLKEISVGELQPDETVDAVREARVLSKLAHPNIVKFHDSFIDGEAFCIITEYCEGGDLDNKINEFKKLKKPPDENLVMDWFVQLVLAVHYMHTRRVLHRDLKTRNIFLKKNMIKIGDFGISRILMGTTDLASTFTGTPYYMSPEVLKHEGYNSKSDIVEGEPPKLPDKYSSELSRILKLREKSHLRDLRETEEEIKYKNLPPRERMRLRKMQQADQEAQRLKEIAKVQLIANQERKSKIHSTLHKTSIPAWAGGTGEGEHFKAALSVVGETPESPPKYYGSHFGSRTAPVQYYYEEEEENLETLKYRPSKTLGSIPDKPDLAETYYSQFNDDFTDSESDDDDEGTLEGTVGTVIQKKPLNKSTGGAKVPRDSGIGSGSDGDETRRSVELTAGTNADEEEHLFNLLQDVLDQGENAEMSLGTLIVSIFIYKQVFCMIFDHVNFLYISEGTMTLADDKEAGAFGPVVREQKIKNLKAECERILGKEGFEKAYNYLKKARYDSMNTEDKSEEDIMQGLRQFVKNPSDCFLVDQLLFLEEQAHVGKGGV
ncbi:hypothetical protein KUTeg_009245 [Tegillarca granosa]|uniref:non-specific serine/threonine protein kinase n=1 Tax=Tegillarca granosa TaxID=220873 RepID=A0ABQ9F743_TEGGR|nr:hypothetical protein KUTeg_009245 [Tegillarca granosa]